MMGEISANSDVKDTFCLLSEMVLKSMYCVSQRFKFVFFPTCSFQQLMKLLPIAAWLRDEGLLSLFRVVSFEVGSY